MVSMIHGWLSKENGYSLEAKYRSISILLMMPLLEDAEKNIKEESLQEIENTWI